MTAKEKGAANLAWGKRPPPARGPKPGLTTTQIARAAIAIADAEGLDAITMQRVARKLGVTTMALYRYFPGKAALISVMIDCAGGPAPDCGPPATPWKDRLREWSHRCASIYRNHPWFLEATTVRRSVMGPNELCWMETALATLAEAGLSPRESYYAFLAIIGHIRGHATFEQIKSRRGPSRQYIRELNELSRSDPRRYPTLQVVLGSGAFSRDPDETFEFGLNCILAGISQSVCSRNDVKRRRPTN
jgi:AcrR family transcriptional regulator